MASTSLSPSPSPRISAPLVAALEAMWAAIVKRHPDVPAAVVVVASGTDGRKSGEGRWGHFAALRWVRGDAQLPEVLVAGEGLARGEEPVLATLLHEAAHGLADARQIHDTSRQGRYHNRHYQRLAEELGLEVTVAGSFGWASTTLSDATRSEYRRELARLAAALTLFRRAERTGAGKARSSNLLACVCGCPRKIRVAAATLEIGPIVCGICDEHFTAGGER
jgi:hypothetical protein